MELDGIRYIVLDVDSTLIYSHSINKGYKISLLTNKVELESLRISERPYLYQFLDKIEEHYTMIIWTAAKRQYAESILLRILKNYNTTLIWTRKNCDKGTKNLSKLANYLHVPVEQLYLIDDNPIHFKTYNQRGYLIKPYKGEKDDDELLKLINDLK